MRKFKLSDSDNERVKKAVSEAESRTSGEIVTAIINESSDYAFFELMASLVGGFIYYTVSLFFYNEISTWLSSIFWEFREVYTTVFIGLSTILVIGLLYILANIPGVDNLIVSSKIIKKKVSRRALLFFCESGLFNTRDRTGVLIFLSLREKRVELIADSGINALVEQDSWNGIVDNLTAELKAGRSVDGLVKAVTSCGDLLVEHFPVKADDENELGDDVHVLED